MAEQDNPAVIPTQGESVADWLHRSSGVAPTVQAKMPFQQDDPMPKEGEGVGEWYSRAEGLEVPSGGSVFSKTVTNLDPERAKRILDVQSRMPSAPPDWIDRNLDKGQNLEQRIRQQDFNSDVYLNTDPDLAKWVTESGPKAAMVRSDPQELARLGKLKILLQRPPSLWPLSEKTVQEDAKKIAGLRAAKDWAAGERINYAMLQGIEGEPPVHYESQKEMEAAYYQQELETRRNIEGIIGGQKNMGPLEALKAKYPDSPVFANLFGAIPVAGHMISGAEKLGMMQAVKQLRENPGDELARDKVINAARLEAVSQMRGKTFFGGHMAELALNLPAMMVEMGMGASAGGAVAEGMMGKAAGEGFGKWLLRASIESAVGGGTMGLPSAAETYLQRATPKGALGEDAQGNMVYQVTNEKDEPQYVAIPKAALSSFADYFGAKVFGPWFTKAGAAEQAIAKKSLIAAFPIEGLKMIGMNEATAAIKGLGGVTTLQAPAIIRAFKDTETAKELGAQFLLGGVMGAGHQAVTNAHIGAAEAQWHSEMLSRVGEMTKESKIMHDSPVMYRDFVDTFSKDGPHPHVYAPIDVWDKYWEGKGVDSREVAKAVLGDTTGYDEAKRLKSSLQIPMADYLSKLAHLDEGDVFAKGFKLDPSKPNVPQAEQQVHTEEGKAMLPEEFLKKADKPYAELWDLGIKGAKADKYAEAISNAEGKAFDEVKAKELAKREVARQAELDTLRKEIRPQVEQAIAQRPEHVALEKLRAAEAEGKLSHEKTAQMYGEQYGDVDRGSFPSGIFSEKGVHPDDLAGPLGFSSGKELVQALQKLKGFDKKTIADMETESVIHEMRPDLHREPTLSDLDLEHLKGENESKLLKMQLDHFLTDDYATFKGLAKALDRQPKSLESIRKDARADVTDKNARNTNPEVYKSAMEEAKREALDKLLSGDIEGMYDARARQLDALEHYRAALDAKTTTGKLYRFMKDAQSTQYRQQLGKAGEDYLEQFDAIAAKYGFSNESAANYESRKMLRDFIAEKQANGESNLENVAAPDWLMEKAYQPNYMDLTNGQQAQLLETLTNLDVMAKTKNKLFTADQKATWEENKTAILGEIEASKEKLPLMPEKDAQVAMDKLTNFMRSAHAGLIKTEELLKEIGNNNIASPLMKFFFHPWAEAEHAMRNMQKKISAAMLQSFSELPDADKATLHERVIFKTKDGDRIMTRKNLLMMAGNFLNDSNMQKTIKGETMRRGGLTEAQMRGALDTLSPGEIDFINKAAKTVGSMLPELNQLHIALTGLPLEKVEGRPLKLKNGTLEGGYWPVMYSADSIEGARQQEARLGDMTSPSYKRATMGLGSRAARIEDFARPMDFDFDNLASVLTANIQDITHRKWMLDANKIFQDKDIANAIEDRYGRPILDRLRENIKEGVNDRNQPNLQSLGWMRGMINGFRQAYAMTATGFKIVVGLEHATSIAVALDPAMLGPSYLGRGFNKMFNGSPKEVYNEAVDKGSTVIPHLIDTANRDIKEALQAADANYTPNLYNRITNGAKHLAAQYIGVANMSRALPIWWGSYYKAMETLPESHGFSGAELEKNAVRMADQNVRLIVGSSGAKDLSAVQAGSKYGDISKLFTMFYTQGSLLYSRASGIKHDFAKTKNLPAALVSGILAWPVAAGIQALVRGEFPRDDKDETWEGWAGKAFLSYGASPLPIGRDAVNYALYQRDSGPLSPGSDVMKSLIDAYETVGKVGDGDATAMEALEKAYGAVNYWMGLPTDQLQTWLDYMVDLSEGDVNSPDDMFEFYRNVLHYHHKPTK